MGQAQTGVEGKRFGFVSTRFAGTDGVSLEAGKWRDVLERQGHACYWFAGKLDTPPAQSLRVDEAHFEHEANRALNAELVGKTVRSRTCTQRIQDIKALLKDRLYAFLERFDVDVLVAQNCLAIPMHIPLGLALTEVVAETGTPTIAHHHDFYWERDRYSITAAPDYLQMAFPPKSLRIQHVVINSTAREQLAHRTGLSSVIVPNVIDFAAAPPAVDAFSGAFRADIGLAEDDILILQPTRVVSRKGIEHAVELVRRLGNPKCKLVVTHDAGDEGMDYQEFLVDYAASVGVDMRVVSRQIAPQRGQDTVNGKHYSLWDVYPHADLVTYPSLYEGFGNAFLEAVYFRKPVLVNRYSIYIRDIEPRGFDVVEMNGYITRAVVDEVREVLEDPARRTAMVERNFALGARYYSYEVLERKLNHLLANVFGVDTL